jgi:hypothetical protein
MYMPMTSAMKICTPEGWRSINPDDVLCVYCGGGDGRYTHWTLVLLGGTKVSGAISNAALAALEALIADDAPPPLAA